MKRIVVVVVVVGSGLTSSLAASGCELFGSIACQEDADCPASVPICGDGNTCGSTGEPDGTRKGLDADEGEGEEPECTLDGDCASTELCYPTDDDSGFFHTCAPPDGTEDCNGAFGSNQPPSDDGPKIFDVVTGFSTCVTVTVRFVAPRANLVDGFASAYINGTNATAGYSTSDTGQTGTLFFPAICAAQPGQSFGLQVFEPTERASNVVCVHPTGAP